MELLEFQEHYFRAKDGLRLYARSYGIENQRQVPIVCLPGLTRNSRDFHPLAACLASPSGGAHRVISLDYRGRGRSDRDSDKSRYMIAVEADDVLTACAHFGVERAIFIGTSRGGLILHHLIVAARPLFAGVILNDIGPVIEIEGLLKIKEYLNARTAPADWASTPGYLQAIHGDDFPILRRQDWQEMAEALYRDDDGIPIADFDPAIAAQMQGLTRDTVPPNLWPQFEAFAHLPMMVVRGEYSTLLSKATLREMARRHPNLLTTTALGQGHAPLLHIDGPRQEIVTFLQRLADPA